MALVVFTIFGQGRQHHWSYLVTDTQGYRYLVDERSLRQADSHSCSFLLRRAGPEGTVESRFFLDFRECTLQKEQEPPQRIRPGTVADTLRRDLAQRLRDRPAR